MEFQVGKEAIDVDDQFSMLLLIPRPLLLAARRRGDGLVCFAMLLTARRMSYRIVHSNSSSLEATTMANWFLHFMFLLPFSSSGGEGVGG